MKKIFIVAILLSLLAPVYVWADPVSVIDPIDKVEKDPVGLALDIVEAVQSEQWRLVAAFALSLMMFLLSKFRKRLTFFRELFGGDRGGAILVMLLAVMGAMVTALMTTVPINWQFFIGAVGVAWTAVGGYTWLKRLLWPKE